MTRTPAPSIVAVCGSTRFRAEINAANRDLTLAGHIVLAPGVFGHDGDLMSGDEKHRLDDLHLAKIDIADWVYIVNPGGYIGESTRREITYATNADKPVSYMVVGSTASVGARLRADAGYLDGIALACNSGGQRKPADKVDAWNEHQRPGTRVQYWPGADSAPSRHGVTVCEAYVLGEHTAVVRVADDLDFKTHLVALTHVRPATEAEIAAADTGERSGMTGDGPPAAYPSRVVPGPLAHPIGLSADCLRAVVTGRDVTAEIAHYVDEFIEAINGIECFSHDFCIESGYTLIPREVVLDRLRETL